MNQEALDKQPSGGPPGLVAERRGADHDLASAPNPAIVIGSRRSPGPLEQAASPGQDTRPLEAGPAAVQRFAIDGAVDAARDPVVDAAVDPVVDAAVDTAMAEALDAFASMGGRAPTGQPAGGRDAPKGEAGDGPQSSPAAEPGSPGPGVQRRLYFLSGFDPRGASFYFRLFGEEVERRIRKEVPGQGGPIRLVRRRQERDRLLSRWRLQPSAIPNPGGVEPGPLGPDPDAENAVDRTGHLEAPPAPSSHELAFLHWDDIARNHWPRRSLGMLVEIAQVYRWYVLQGGLLRIGRLCPGVALCGAYPGLFTLLALVLALGGAAGLGSLAAGALPSASLALGAGALVSVTTGWLLLLAAWTLADRLGVVWLWRSIRFTHRLGQARDGELRSRVAELAGRIQALEAQAPADTVLLVGHSSGSFVMAMLAAELRRQSGGSALASRLSLLSLGQNLANLAVYPGAQAFHADLQELAREPRLPWLDITSRDDLLCFAGVDPYRSCGLPPPAGAPYPTLQLVPLARPKGWLERLQLAFQQFDLHFRYLRQSPVSHGFDPLSQLLKP